MNVWETLLMPEPMLRDEFRFFLGGSQFRSGRACEGNTAAGPEFSLKDPGQSPESPLTETKERLPTHEGPQSPFDILVPPGELHLF